jgi:hypothetical protein
MLLEHGSLVQQLALGEAGWTKSFDVAHDVGFPMQNQIRENSAGGRGMHHAVSAEAVGAE